jgi:hypothetical protein
MDSVLFEGNVRLELRLKIGDGLPQVKHLIGKPNEQPQLVGRESWIQ